MSMLLTGAAGGLLLPAGLVVLFFLGAVVRRFRNRPAVGGPGTPAGGRGAGATATEELHALLYPSKRVQLEQRRIELVLRDDEHDGAPKRTGIDLAGGRAVIRRGGGETGDRRQGQPVQAPPVRKDSIAARYGAMSIRSPASQASE
ncbi:DUF6191 domain-containing protein [Kitasatospora aureofaciens]|uniref:DUF6191 domain-containing protein n=1 Tax=Kitasatospora aureofaciens TaxID=1894 RepID=UPI00067DC77D|nr:DUF6191 domain-containing protein [Kitasatospora aureofaciens]ARF77542.1 hypothetical protein B6264_00120 [Kitasatospora aureofaciens]QEU98702.1 hypothetical protein CP971_04710 [Streptomyces viridifaciens]UKZ04676.1 DUF6191 domain-containing protein [Streptomyces viridifaciens]